MKKPLFADKLRKALVQKEKEKKDMKYYLMWISNGSIQKDKIAEYSDKSAAIAAFATKWAALEGTAEVKSYIVQLVDSNFDVVDGCKRSNVKEQ